MRLKHWVALGVLLLAGSSVEPSSAAELPAGAGDAALEPRQGFWHYAIQLRAGEPAGVSTVRGSCRPVCGARNRAQQRDACVDSCSPGLT